MSPHVPVPGWVWRDEWGVPLTAYGPGTVYGDGRPQAASTGVDSRDAHLFRCQACGDWRYAWWGAVVRACLTCGDSRGPAVRGGTAGP